MTDKELIEQANIQIVLWSIEAFTDPEGNMPDNTGEFNDLKACIPLLQAFLDRPPQIDKLRYIIACAYQIAGAYDAPEYVLDVLGNPDGATQKQIDALLPFSKPVQPELEPVAWVNDVPVAYRRRAP